MFKNKKKLLIAVFTFIFLFSSLQLVRGEGIEVIIPAEVEVVKTPVLLGDISEINAFDDETEEHIAAIELGTAPRAGYRGLLSRNIVAAKLQEQFDQLETDIILQMPARGTIIRLRTRQLDYDNVLDALMAYIIDNLNYDEEDKEKIDLEIIYSPGEIFIPDTEYSLEVKTFDLEQIPGENRVKLEVVSQGDSWQNIFLGVKTTVSKEVFVALNDVLPRQQLNKDDFVKKSVELDRLLTGKIIKDWQEDIVQQGITRYRIREGNILTDYYLREKNEQDRLVSDDKSEKNETQNKGETEYNQNQNQVKNTDILVRWGDELEANVTIGHITVSAKVRARDTGSRGDIITVENLKSGKLISAKIINSETVQVEL